MSLSFPTWSHCSTFAGRDPSILVGDSDHSTPEWADPDSYRERVTEDELIQMIPKFDQRFPGFSGARLSSSYAGCYDVTPDYNPMISASPIEGLWLCAGFSGHGYKISPSVGELMADIITKGTSRHPDIDHYDFRWERFVPATTWSAPIPTLVLGKCAEPTPPRNPRQGGIYWSVVASRQSMPRRASRVSPKKETPRADAGHACETGAG